MDLLPTVYDWSTGSWVKFVGLFWIAFILFYIKPICQFLELSYNTVWRDVSGAFTLLKISVYLFLHKRQNATVPVVFSRTAARYPDKVIFHFEDQSWTYREFDELTNRIGNYFRSEGLKAGDQVALLMESSPLFVAYWLGLSKAGVVSALINSNQKMETLAHSVNMIKAKAFIFDSNLSQVAVDVVPLLEQRDNLKLYCHGEVKVDQKSAQSLVEALEAASPEPVPFRGNFTDPLYYIFTSGTTGLPKASTIKHARFFMAGLGAHYGCRMNSKDIVYICLPLYHSNGGMVGMAHPLLYGNTTVVRKKFSASKFWSDIVKYNCTMTQYIGELCRYLLTQPEHQAEKEHKVRVILGNGLRTNIWRSFQSRFHIGQIVEFYGQTEGNASLINLNGWEGSCGFISLAFPIWLLNIIYPVAIVRVREGTQEPLRGEDGLFVRSRPGEIGLLVSKIHPLDPVRCFDGYLNTEATKKVIARNALSLGDKVYVSGDLLRMDRFGYLYFVDRTGDTFRWKGENVSTTEVESAIGSAIGLTDCIVFGVEVAGCEGKAGMAAILDADRALDVNRLLSELKKILPAYAVPVFIRLVKQIDSTETLKFSKVKLRKEGYDLDAIDDPMFVLDAKSRLYEKLDQAYFNNNLISATRF